MAKQKQITNINKHKFKWNIDIGIIIFGLIFIYLIANLVIYLTSSHITAYEVREGAIITDTAYTGFAVRSEKVTYASSAGYVNYLLNEGDKAAVGNPVYSITSSKQTKTASQTSKTLTEEEKEELITKTQKFNLSYDPSSFGNVYDFSYDCKSSILDYMNSIRQSESTAQAVNGIAAENDGIIAFTIDGFEDITSENFQVSCLNRSAYSKTDVRNREQIKSGDPVYKTIMDDTWYLYLALSDETAEQLKDTKSLKVLFKKDNEYVTGALTITKMDDQNIACLEFTNSVVRYANDRYLDVELIFDDQAGLKIPKSAVVEKEFYAVPNSYITKGGNTNASGVYVRSSDDNNGSTSVFTTLDIYFSDDEYSYVPGAAFDKGAVLLKPESTDTYEIKKTKKLKGVYNINKGYAVFRLIHILNGNDTYYIVKEGESYGLYNYDQIVLDGSKVDENEIVFQ